MKSRKRTSRRLLRRRQTPHPDQERRNLTTERQACNLRSSQDRKNRTALRDNSHRHPGSHSGWGRAERNPILERTAVLSEALAQPSKSTTQDLSPWAPQPDAAKQPTEANIHSRAAQPRPPRPPHNAPPLTTAELGELCHSSPCVSEALQPRPPAPPSPRRRVRRRAHRRRASPHNPRGLTRRWLMIGPTSVQSQLPLRTRRRPSLITSLCVRRVAAQNSASSSPRESSRFTVIRRTTRPLACS